MHVRKVIVMLCASVNYEMVNMVKHCDYVCMSLHMSCWLLAWHFA